MASSPVEPSPPSPQRMEPLRLKPTTLPHSSPPIDTCGAGERIDSKQKYSLPTPTPSTVELVQTASQTAHVPDTPVNSAPWPAVFLIVPLFYTMLFYIHSSLRISFYLLVLTLTIGLTLAACKFTNIWDPCEVLYIVRTDCRVTSYFKGMMYHMDCTEEHKCILPGFESIIQRQGWSLHKPNETSTSSGSIFNE